MKCRKEAMPTSQFCLKHWFYKQAVVALHDSKKAAAIEELFYAQDELCAYTEEKLIPGVNASLDHKTPLCRGGNHDIENLHWVTKRINGAKFYLTHEEFVQQCAHIAHKHLHTIGANP